jgi:tripeptide aminopeptidase
MKIPPRLKPITDRLEDYQKGVRALREQILTNTILVGQVPPISVNIKQDDVDFPSVNIRVKAFIERLSEIGVDEAATDSFGNAIGIIKGEGEREGCIIVAAIWIRSTTSTRKSTWRSTATASAGRGSSTTR